jgi:NAD(P)-dependent dehydrogenase (short-subunit alcohol dehydrogenase family)
MPTALIVGASRGIGLELARQYREAGWKVHATCRGHCDKLKALGTDVRVHTLDVIDPDGIDDLKQALAGEPIDLLFHVAGIWGQKDAALGNTDDEKWLHAFRVNTLAPMNVITALRENVAASDKKLVAAMTSKMGSMADNSSGSAYVYRSSKAALNAVMKSLSIDLATLYGITTLVMHPGWVKTDMTGPGALITPAESVAGLRQVLERCTLADAGTFYDYQGNVVPW